MIIIGHEKIIQFLDKSVESQHLSHAYLFYGPSHIGKSKVAEYFVAKNFCLERNGPCGQCFQCQQVFKNLHPDVFWLKDSLLDALENKKISVEQSRQIKNFLFSSPLAGRKKIVIIEKAENLSLSAVNALLKILEEPPGDGIIILISQGFKSLPATIRSRCQILRFSLPPREQALKFLQKEFSFKRERAEEVFDLSDGKIGLAIEFSQNQQTLELKKELIERFLDFFENNWTKNRFRMADLIISWEDSPQKNLNALLFLIRDIIMIKRGAVPLNRFIAARLKNFSSKCSQEKLISFIYQINRTQLLLTANVNAKMAVENLLINQ